MPRPASVPEAAFEVNENVTLGRIERRANEPPEPIDTRSLLTAACNDGVMVLWTSEETVHAAMSCDKFWDSETVQAFSSREVALDLVVSGTRFQIFVETLPGAQSEFTVDGIWVE